VRQFREIRRVDPSVFFRRAPRSAELAAGRSQSIRRSCFRLIAARLFVVVAEQSERLIQRV